MPPRTTQTKSRLNTPDSKTKEYIAELEKQNKKLHKEIAKFQVKNLDCENRLKALKKEFEDNRPELHININTEFEGKTYSPEELEAKLIEKIRAMGYSVTKIES